VVQPSFKVLRVKKNVRDRRKSAREEGFLERESACKSLAVPGSACVCVWRREQVFESKEVGDLFKKSNCKQVRVRPSLSFSCRSKKISSLYRKPNLLSLSLSLSLTLTRTTHAFLRPCVKMPACERIGAFVF
jgi:hypothetical protein